MVWALSLLTIKLSPDRLTPVLLVLGIRSLAEFGNLERLTKERDSRVRENELRPSGVPK